MKSCTPRPWSPLESGRGLGGLGLCWGTLRGASAWRSLGSGGLQPLPCLIQFAGLLLTLLQQLRDAALRLAAALAQGVDLLLTLQDFLAVYIRTPGDLVSKLLNFLLEFASVAALAVHIQQRPFHLARMALLGRRCHCALPFEFPGESLLGCIQRCLQLLAVDCGGFDLALLGSDLALGAGQLALQGSPRFQCNK